MRRSLLCLLLLALGCATPEERELALLDARLQALIEVSLSDDPVPGLVAALDDPLPEVRTFALTDLPRLGVEARPAVPKVIAMLEHDPDPGVRQIAADVLAELAPHDPRIPPALVRAGGRRP